MVTESNAGGKAFGAALTPHQVGSTQLGQDRFDKLARQTLMSDEKVGLHQLGTVRSVPFRLRLPQLPKTASFFNQQVGADRPASYDG